MFSWPNLELTDYERKYCRIYKTKDKPGVLRRTYKVVLNNTAAPSTNLPVIKLSGQVQIARRSRLFGLTFGGNTDSWRLGITNASGTLYTVKTPRSNLDPMVTSMLPGMLNNASSLGGVTAPLDPFNYGDGIGPNAETSIDDLTATGRVYDSLMTKSFHPFPMLIDPNWLLMPNETIIFNGTPVPVTYESLFTTPAAPATVTPPLILTIGVHVWEFPGMEGRGI